MWIYSKEGKLTNNLIFEGKTVHYSLGQLHYSKSIFFFQKINFNKTLLLDIFEFLRPNWKIFLNISAIKVSKVFIFDVFDHFPGENAKFSIFLHLKFKIFCQIGFKNQVHYYGFLDNKWRFGTGTGWTKRNLSQCCKMRLFKKFSNTMKIIKHLRVRITCFRACCQSLMLRSWPIFERDCSAAVKPLNCSSWSVALLHL